jgi:3',5'-cyclic AMP phosphodiesterase CpdA
VLHISDLHFGPPYVPAVGEALLRSAFELKPDIIVASGDFTQRARPDQFAAARDFLNALPAVPRIVVPGNHDIPLYRVGERILRPYDLYREYISPDLEGIHRADNRVIVALNTTDPLRRITNGRIRQAQLDYCEEAFRTAPAGALKIVVAHHHFAPAPDYDNQSDVMKGAKEALERFILMGVDLILGGHLHRAYIGNSLDVHPSTDRSSGIIIAQSGTSTSQRGRAREREKNSFNLIKIGEDVVRVTHYMHFHEAAGFAPISRHIFPRRNRHFFTGHHAHE